MLTLLSTVSLPYLRLHALRMFLTLIGVVIGVQGMVAMGALNGSIVRSFEKELEVIAGNATLQVAGPDTGIPETLVAETAGVAGVASATAMIQGSFTTVDGSNESIGVFGIDLVEQLGTRNPQFPRENVHIDDELVFANSADSIALGRPLMERRGLAVGSTIDLVTPNGVRTFTVRGVLDPVGPAKLYGGAVALLDLPSAQRLMLAPGLVQTIYVEAAEAESTDAVAKRLSNLIGGRARIERTSVRGRQVEAILGSVRVALSLASLFTVVVGFFIIYQTIAVSVEQRRREIAILRSLGFLRRSVAAVFLSEAFLLGVLGAAGGVAGGYWLARFSLRVAVQGISGVYFPITTTELVLPFAETAGAAGLGIAACLIAGLAPALRAAREAPASVLSAAAGAQVHPIRLRSVVVGLFVLTIAVGLLTLDLRLPTAGARTAWIMGGHFTFLLGFFILAPAVVWMWARALKSLALYASLPISLAADFFIRKPHRIAGAVSAIMVGYSLVVILSSVVYSMKLTLGEWLAQAMASDLTVAVPPTLEAGSFDGSIAGEIERIPGVQSVERRRRTVYEYAGQPIVLFGFEPRRTPVRIIEELPGAYEAAESGDAVFVSESFAFRFGHKLGDTLHLDTAIGTRSFQIAAIARDYSFELGTIILHIDVYQRLWKDTRLSYASIRTSADADLDGVRSKTAAIIQGYPNLQLATSAEYRAEVEQRLYDLLRVLSSLQIFAGVIAMLGVMNVMLAAVLDRRRELALLRSVGVTRRQIRIAIIIEASLIGLAGASLGVLEGVPASFYMVTHSIRVAMNWSLDFQFATGLAFSAALAVIVAAGLAGYIPARQITSGSVMAGLRAE